MLGENTIETHVTRVFAKLGLRDRAQAVVVAYETGLVVPEVRAYRRARERRDGGRRTPNRGVP